MKRLLVALLMLPLACNAAELKTGSIVLLQPEASMREKQLDVKAMAAYLRAASAAAADSARQETLPMSSGFLVFAVREGGLSNAWVDMTPALPPSVEAKIVSAIQRVPSFPVARGTLVFAAKTSINGASEPAGNMPLPMAWKAAIAGRKESIEIEALVGLAWPDHYIAAHAAGGGNMQQDKRAPESHFDSYYQSGQKRDVYNSVTKGQDSKFDALAHQTLDGRFHVIDLTDGSPRWGRHAHPLSGSMPPTPLIGGKPLHGYVMIAYLVAPNGRAEAPTIVQSTDPQLAKIALAATETFRFEPAFVDGKIVETVAMQEFKF